MSIFDYISFINYEEFLKLYEKFYARCPNPKIVEGCKSKADADNIWSNMEIKNRECLDKDETLVLIKTLIIFNNLFSYLYYLIGFLFNKIYHLIPLISIYSSFFKEYYSFFH